MLWSNNMFISSYANSTRENLSRKDIINFVTTMVCLCSNYLMQADKLNDLIWDCRLRETFLREAGHKNAIVKPLKSTKSDLSTFNLLHLLEFTFVYQFYSIKTAIVGSTFWNPVQLFAFMSFHNNFNYCTRAIISRGLYTFYPLFENHFFVYKEVFRENFGLMYG